MLSLIRFPINYFVKQKLTKNITKGISDVATKSDKPVQHKTKLTQITPSSKRIDPNKRSPVSNTFKFQTINKALVSNEEYHKFIDTYPEIFKELTESKNLIITDIPELKKHFKEAVDYNVPQGKKLRCLSFLAAYKTLEKPENLTLENMKLAFLMGWIIEMIESLILVTDDIVDRSKMRRGTLCWYMRDDVGLKAINDANLIGSCIFALLQKHFSNHRCYSKFVELCGDVIMKTMLGQTYECTVCENGKPKLDVFTMDMFKSIAKYKTSFCTFHLPIELAMYMANFEYQEMYKQINMIFFELGFFYQMQNDFRDLYTDMGMTGKEGTDIQDGKCTLFAVLALERGNLGQKKIMEKYYGSAEGVTKIQDIYKELNLYEAYLSYQEESFNKVCSHISKIPDKLVQDFFYKLVKQVYKREF